MIRARNLPGNGLIYDPESADLAKRKVAKPYGKGRANGYGFVEVQNWESRAVCETVMSL